MRIELNENIKAMRKQRGMTQEGLAEAMGVSVGAVSKWESALSYPDIETIAELASFFETSVDALLGHGWQQASAGAAVEEIKQIHLKKRFGDADFARKALQRFPNNFDVVYTSAKLFSSIGMESHDNGMLEEAKRLYERACELISQNTDKQISRASIQVRISGLLGLMEKYDEAIALLEDNNADGVYNADIGRFLTAQKRYDEAIPVLSDSLLDNTLNLFLCCMGMSQCLSNSGSGREAIELIDWVTSALEGLKQNNCVNYINKMQVFLRGMSALIAFDINEPYEQRLRDASSNAKAFDASPDFSCKSIRFYHSKDRSLYDNAEKTAQQTLEQMILSNQKADSEIYLKWKEIAEE